MKKTMTFTIEKFKEIYFTPIVYLFYNKKKVLYVGRSYCGMYRVLTQSNKFENKRRRNAWHGMTHIKIYFCSSRNKASLLERKLLTKHNPKFNIDIPGYKRKPYTEWGNSIRKSNG